MTDEQLKQGQSLKRTIQLFENELEKFDSKKLPKEGINVFLPNEGSLIDDVKQVFIKHLKEHNEKFKKL